jgi:hypothetical protein
VESVVVRRSALLQGDVALQSTNCQLSLSIVIYFGELDLSGLGNVYQRTIRQFHFSVLCRQEIAINTIPELRWQSQERERPMDCLHVVYLRILHDTVRSSKLRR